MNIPTFTYARLLGCVVLLSALFLSGCSSSQGGAMSADDTARLEKKPQMTQEELRALAGKPPTQTPKK